MSKYAGHLALDDSTRTEYLAVATLVDSASSAEAHKALNDAAAALATGRTADANVALSYARFYATV